MLMKGEMVHIHIRIYIYITIIMVSYTQLIPALTSFKFFKLHNIQTPNFNIYFPLKKISLEFLVACGSKFDIIEHT